MKLVFTLNTYLFKGFFYEQRLRFVCFLYLYLCLLKKIHNNLALGVFNT